MGDLNRKAVRCRVEAEAGREASGWGFFQHRLLGGSEQAYPNDLTRLRLRF